MRFTRIVAVLAGVMFLGAAALAQGLDRPETLEDTAALIRDRLQASGRFDEVTMTEDFAVIGRNEGQNDQVFYPDNLHLLLRRLDDPAARANALATHIAALEEATRDDAELSVATLDRVIPVVRHRDYGGSEPDSPLIRQPLAGDLAVFYVLDSPSTVQYITETSLTEAKLTLGQLRDAATENLAQLEADIRIERGVVSILFLDGYYESSLLLDNRLWHGLARDVPNLIAIAPARDLVAFGDGSNPQVAEFLATKAAEISDSVGGVLSAEVLHWTEVGWVAD